METMEETILGLNARVAMARALQSSTKKVKEFNEVSYHILQEITDLQDKQVKLFDQLIHEAELEQRSQSVFEQLNSIVHADLKNRKVDCQTDLKTIDSLIQELETLGLHADACLYREHREGYIRDRQLYARIAKRLYQVKYPLNDSLVICKDLETYKYFPGASVEVDGKFQVSFNQDELDEMQKALPDINVERLSVEV